MSLLFNLDDSAVVEKVTMKWPSDDYFIPAGTPMSREGIANDGNAVGVLASPAKVEFTFPDSIARLIGKKEPKGNLDYTFDIITAGFVDIKKAEASFGGKIEPAAKSAMAGIRFIESASDLGGDYFEIKFDWATMTCNYSASEIREASDAGRSFIGNYFYDEDAYDSDIQNNTATIISWIRSNGNVIYKYIVHEDKTVEELADGYRLIPGEPIMITVVSGNYCTYTATELKNIIQNNKLELVPLIYLIKDGYVYNLVFYQLDNAGTGNLFRFACVTDTAIKFAEISGESDEVTFTEKLFS